MTFKSSPSPPVCVWRHAEQTRGDWEQQAWWERLMHLMLMTSSITKGQRKPWAQSYDTHTHAHLNYLDPKLDFRVVARVLRLMRCGLYETAMRDSHDDYFVMKMVQCEILICIFVRYSRGDSSSERVRCVQMKRHVTVTYWENIKSPLAHTELTVRLVWVLICLINTHTVWNTLSVWLNLSVCCQLKCCICWLDLKSLLCLSGAGAVVSVLMGRTAAGGTLLTLELSRAKNTFVHFCATRASLKHTHLKTLATVCVSQW